MANSLLKNKNFTIPSSLMEYLSRVFDRYKYSSDENGYKRLKNLISDNKISYENLKRIKNFFDTYNGSKQDIEYILNGGDRMKVWVNNALNLSRKMIENHKKSKKEVGVYNSYKKEHDKDYNKNPTKIRIPKLHKSMSNNDITNNNVNYENIYRGISDTKKIITEIYKK